MLRAPRRAGDQRVAHRHHDGVDLAGGERLHRRRVFEPVELDVDPRLLEPALLDADLERRPPRPVAVADPQRRLRRRRRRRGGRGRHRGGRGCGFLFAGGAGKAESRDNSGDRANVSHWRRIGRQGCQQISCGTESGNLHVFVQVGPSRAASPSTPAPHTGPHDHRSIKLGCRSFDEMTRPPQRTPHSQGYASSGSAAAGRRRVSTIIAQSSWGAGASANVIPPPARRHPTAPSQVRGRATGRGSFDAGGGSFHPSNHGPELRGSTPGGARRCLQKFSSTYVIARRTSRGLPRARAW